MQIYRWARFVLIPAVLLIMGFSIYQLIRIYTEYKEGDESYKQIEQQFVLPPRTRAPASEEGKPQIDNAGDPTYEIAILTAAPGTDGSVPLTGEEQIVLPGASGAPELPAYTPEAQSAEPTPAATLPPTPAPEPTETPIPEYAPISVDFDGLRSMNGECVGWIYIPDTSVSYPVMQTSNNSKYLDTLPDGTKHKAGSIFMDFRNDSRLTDGNIVIYGHRLESGSMFSPLRKYEKRSFFDEHRYVYYLTPDGDYKITVIACATVDAWGEAYELYENRTELHNYLRSILGRAHVSASVDPDQIDRIVTLSTCTGQSGTRTIVIGFAQRLL